MVINIVCGKVDFAQSSPLPNNRINLDSQFRYAPLPAGYAKRCGYYD